MNKKKITEYVLSQIDDAVKHFQGWDSVPWEEDFDLVAEEFKKSTTEDLEKMFDEEGEPLIKFKNEMLPAMDEMGSKTMEVKYEYDDSTVLITITRK